jgi:hypothetical protein
MVTGAGPQENVITPPAATAATTACEVQPAGVPSPMIRLGFEVSSALASPGIAAFPAGFPYCAGGAGCGAGEVVVAGGGAEVVAETDGGTDVSVDGSAGRATLVPGVVVAQPLTKTSTASTIEGPRMGGP